MKSIIVSTVLLFSLLVYTSGLKLEQCPPGYRCRKPTTSRLFRSFAPQVQEELDVDICEAGTYSPGGSDTCTPCEQGTYAAQAGAPSCYICPRGYMCQQVNLVPEQCPIGTYNNLTRQACCRGCPAGKFARLKGMYQCEDCPSGQRCPAGKKLACETEI